MGTDRLKPVRDGRAARCGRLLRDHAAPVAVFAPMAPAMLLAGILALPAFDGHTVFGNILCGVFGDWLIPAVFLLAALRFRSRFCAALAALLACADLLLRIAALALYRSAHMTLDFRELELLWMHTDGVALRAFLGEHYPLWLIPAILLLIAAAAVPVVAAWRNIRALAPRPRRRWMAVTAALLTASLSCHFWLFCAEKLENPMIYTDYLVRPLTVQTAMFIRDAGCRRRRPDPVPLSDAGRRTLEAMDVIPPRGGEPPAAPARFDRIVIIALESLDLEFVRGVDPRMPDGVTPNLDRLMREYPSMTNFFCSAQPTSWGLTGLLMSRFDYNWDLEEAGKRPSLFSIASQQGYLSCYFSPMTGVFAENRRYYGKLFAPDRQYYLEEWAQKYGMRRSSEWGLRDDELYSCVLKEMRSWKERRFVVLISTMDTHWPYSSTGISAVEKRRFPTAFLQALHMADRHLGEFLREFMADEKLYDDRTLIVVTSDHTATHGENYLQRQDFIPERVPLIFITPDRSVFAALDTKKYASGVDLTPTLVNFVGGRAPESFMGRSLFSKKNLAISWLHSGNLLLRSPKWKVEVGATPDPDPEKQAVVDFFRSQY